MAPVPEDRKLQRRELGIVVVIAAVQFINIVDFMMVTPLGPFFAHGLDIPKSNLALIAAAYTAAAGLAGLAGSFFLDRFDRRPALAISIFGLVVGTALGGVSIGLGTLIAARAVAGLFGGPATSLSMAIVADVVPVERRGRAMSVVMTAFSAATVLGVPVGLSLAEWGGWRMPFFAIAATGVVINLAAYKSLPPLRGHLERKRSSGTVREEFVSLLRKRTVRLSFTMTAVVMMAGFILIPNFPAYLVDNLSLPSDQLKYLYLAGGLASIVTLRVAGRMVDRHGSFKVGSIATGFLVAAVYFYVVHFVPGTPVSAMFVVFMMCMNFRNVAYNTLASRVPEPAERARFQSLQSAVQHTASALAGGVSAWILKEATDGKLLHVDVVGLISIGLSLAVPLFLFIVEREVESRPKQPMPLSGPVSVSGPAGTPVAPDAR
ncbi:MAG: MFS transporter [Myxococcaceae bacterium]